jgi:predicted short-subunit dehydrogenase-like oxidoreductase (DUF2520 family)
LKIVLIGSGNVATHLGIALKAADHNIVQVFSRNEKSAGKLAKKLSSTYTTYLQKISPEAETYIISVSDNAIEEIAASLRLRQTQSLKPGIPNPILLHTSGTVPMNVFEKKFTRFGVLYPIQTFSIKHPVDFSNVPVCIETNNPATKKIISALAKSITKKIHYINSEQRKHVHLAAVFANNFSNHLFTISEHILKKEKISFDLLRPLILETALKVQRNSPSDMQTGPAKRGDSTVLEEHLKMLSSKKRFKSIYKLISESIEEMNGIRM